MCVCVQAVLPNVESLETGVLDLEQWLLEGEQLLASHKLDGTAEAAEARLDRHKVKLHLNCFFLCIANSMLLHTTIASGSLWFLILSTALA